MRYAPSDRRLARVVQDLAWGNFSGGSERVMFLGPRGEVREVFYPNGDDISSLLTKRADLLGSQELSAVVYLGVSILEGLAQMSVVEFFDSDGQRTAHVITTFPETYRWEPLAHEGVDQWLESKYQLTGEGKEEPPEKSSPDKP
jgi:hypothetical protein